MSRGVKLTFPFFPYFVNLGLSDSSGVATAPSMGTKHFRSIHDFARHRRDIEVTCYCGWKAVLPYRPIIARFSEEGWPINLESAARRFRCSKCGSAPAFIGPIER